MARQNYAVGKVISLARGASELDIILESSWCFDYCVIVDYSVAWCGPCRMLEPRLAQLAREFSGTLAVVKVDCEGTPDNRALARREGIAAYPTIQLYADRVLCDTVRGANFQAIRDFVAGKSTGLKAAAKISRDTMELATTLAEALDKVKSSCSTNDEFTIASRTLLAYMKNIVLHSSEEKYRRIRVNNAQFQNKLASKDGGIECMKILGFEEETADGEEILIMKSIHPRLKMVTKLLDQVVPVNAAKVGQSPSRPATSGSPITPEALANILQQAMRPQE